MAGNFNEQKMAEPKTHDGAVLPLPKLGLAVIPRPELDGTEGVYPDNIYRIFF